MKKTIVLALLSVFFAMSGTAQEKGQPVQPQSLANLLWPLLGDKSDGYASTGYKFGDPWLAERHCGGVRKLHTGLDINMSRGKAVAVGDKVYASEDGTVKLNSYTGPVWATTMVLEHSGFVTIYQHVTPIPNLPAQVKRGQQIATIAPITGGGPHLHFGIRNGSYKSSILRSGQSVTLRGALPQKHGQSNYYPDGSSSYCVSDPLFTEESFVNPLDSSYDSNGGVDIIQFAQSSYLVVEGGGSASIKVSRIGPAQGTVKISYATVGGSAVKNRDYYPSNGVLTFGPGEHEKAFSVSIINDNTSEPLKTIELALFSPTGGASLGEPRTATLNIADDDNVCRPSSRKSSNCQESVLQFGRSGYAVSEGAGAVTVTVERSGDVSGAVGVDYLTADGSAIKGIDYINSFGTLVFEPGIKSKTFSIPILNDAVVEEEESFSVKHL
jgi:murein DD-endopeptidase MepM/ murein hydrolase activator NlpD